MFTGPYLLGNVTFAAPDLHGSDGNAVSHSISAKDFQTGLPSSSGSANPESFMFSRG